MTLGETFGSMVRAIMMAAFGIILGCVGPDSDTGLPRFGFGVPELMDGIGLAPFVMGLFGISEVLINLEEGSTGEILKTKIKNFFPNIALKEWWVRF